MQLLDTLRSLVLLEAGASRSVRASGRKLHMEKGR